MKENLFGKRVRVTIGHQTCLGIAIGLDPEINDDSHWCVALDDGSEVTVDRQSLEVVED